MGDGRLLRVVRAEPVRPQSVKPFDATSRMGDLAALDCISSPPAPVAVAAPVHHGPNGGNESAQDFACRVATREFEVDSTSAAGAGVRSTDANGLMGYPPVETARRAGGDRGPTPPASTRSPANPAPAARPARPGNRGEKLRLTVALLLTVGAVVLLGTMDDSSDSAQAGAVRCESSDPVADLSPVQSRNARIVTGVARERGLDQPAAEIAVATALAETGLINFANDGTSELYASEINRPLTDIEREVARRSLDYPHDEVGNNLDSIGLFQQRPTTGWGAPEKLIDPASAAGLFYDKLLRIENWPSGVPWQVAQKVQSSPSANGEIYQAAYARAVTVVGALWAESGCPA
jgi:hypothetical protein